ncbi:MAG: MFS transporter [Acidobacteriota bacterium]
MDRLPWSRWHWLVVVGLGITWILDGLEVTIVGSLSGVLQDSRALGFSSPQLGLTHTSYLAGAVLGALFFGYLTDRLGRKMLFTVTLAVYLGATALTAFSWNLWSFALFRFFTGAGIGGEYAAINSAVDELIPARVRGRTDLIINASFWVGTAMGALASLFFLNEKIFHINFGWRLGFGVGALMGLIILVMRHFLPESPRWLMTHGRVDEAERIVSEIESKVKESIGSETLPVPTHSITVDTSYRPTFMEIIRTILGSYRRRALLGLALMLSQAFFYNGIFFSYPIILINFYNIPAHSIGLYILPFALGNFTGPILLGHLFDTVGRRIMISATYMISAVMLTITGYLFSIGTLSATTQTIAWMLIFFVASAAASSAYLTVSEIFPVETRAMAIALFYSIGTACGGAVAPIFFGMLIQTGNRADIFNGYLLGSVLMIGAALLEVFLGVDAERKSLEEIAKPLSTCEAERC